MPDFSQVKPLILSHCSGCHRPGEAAPFPLLTYEDVAKRASFIKKVVMENYMPPWKADPHYRDFANNRSLSKEEKALLLAWIDAGAPKGNDVGIPKGNDAGIPKGSGVGTPRGNDVGIPKGSAGTFQEGLEQTAYGRKPDLTIKLDSSYLVTGDNDEKFVEFRVSYRMDDDKNVEAVEFYCNNKKIIHHINYGFYGGVDTAGAALKNVAYYTGWIPGSSVESYPAGFGWKLPKKGVVVFTVHYSAIGADEHSVVGVNLFFTSKPVERQVKIISLGSGGIGERDIMPPMLLLPEHQDSFHLQVMTQENQSLLYVWPHMHYLGKTFSAFAITPSKDTIPLVRILNWDFRWQELYKLSHPLLIPAGSIIDIKGYYDNTSTNPFNPNSPPKVVMSTGDMRSKDEMLTLLLIYVPTRAGDESIKL
jgi:hypothetical protein